MTANYIDVDVHKVDKYGNSAVKPKRQGSTQTHRRSVPVNKIELLYTQLKRSPRLKMQHRWRHERRFQKKMQARLFLSTHTTTKNWWECLLRSPLSTSYWDLLYNMGLILTATKIWRLSLRISPSSDFRLTASGETSSTFLHIASHQRQKFCSNLSLRWPTSWKLINTDPGCTNQNQNGKGAKTSNSNSGCKKL